MDKGYCVIVKTGDSELRAMRNLSHPVLDKIFPVVELTRGRAKKVVEGEKTSYVYPYTKKIEHIREIFKGKDIAFDVTSDEALSSKEIDLLFEANDGYANWVNEVVKLNDTGDLASITPSVIMDYDDENFEENVKKQVETLSSKFDRLMYRCAPDNEAAAEDVKLIVESMGADVELMVIVDCGYVPAAFYTNPANVCVSKIAELKEVLSGYKHCIVVCSTTFPNNVSEIGDDETDTFDLKEIALYEIVHAAHKDVIYGDYGSINPVRNDQVIMARGWIPRIDVALEEKVYYYRKRRPPKTSAYAGTYNYVARNAVADDRFPEHLSNEWGYKQIVDCSLGDTPSASPSFWISVRMNSHIVQQVKRLKL